MIDRSEAEIARLTEEQYDVLDMLDANPRVLVFGGAGTGKTVLAREQAVRSANAGKRTLLMCLSGPLADRLRAELARLQIPDLEVATFHDWLRDRILASSFSSEFLAEEASSEGSGPSPATTLEELYLRFGELAGIEAQEWYEQIVIDEAQDLLAESTLRVLDTWIEGGISGGCWAFYGDPYRQALFSDRDPEAGVAALKLFGAAPVRLDLRRNLRNTHEIGLQTAVLSGFESIPYKLSDTEGIPVSIEYWNDTAEASVLLEAELKRLVASGVSPEDIVILSPRRLDASAARQVDGVKISDQWPTDPGSGEVRFATVQEFKGLEARAVILVDISELLGDQAARILYVGMSRARSFLALHLSEGARPQMKELIRRSLK